LSNMVFLPIATKLETRSKEEVAARELMLQGLLGLIDGESPRGMEAKLKSYLAPKARNLEAKTEALSAA
jgi:chemotaxis protein MotA